MKSTCDTCARWVERVGGKDKCGWCPLEKRITEPEYTCSGYYSVVKEHINDRLEKVLKIMHLTKEEVAVIAEEVWKEFYSPKVLAEVACCCGCVHSTGVSEENSWEYYCSVLRGQTDLEVVEVKGFNVCYKYKKDEMR